MASLSAYELFSLAATIASLVLAIGAIWLSIVFYKMSESASKATNEAAKGISASVERLEKLFDKMYSDTFSMMKDTVADMRNHIWKNPNVEMPSATEAIEKEISPVLEREGVKDKKAQEEIVKIVETLINQEMANFSVHDISQEQVLDAIKSNQPIQLQKLSRILKINEPTLAFNYLFPMRASRIITWDGSEDGIRSDSLLSVVRLRGSRGKDAQKNDAD